jgi:hypothetical protein
MFHPDKKPEFLDYASWDDMNFCDRKLMHIELAVGMASEENQLQRQQIITQSQTQLYTTVQTMVTAGTLTPEMYKKVKKPYEDTLYILGIKDANTYLPTDEEVLAMIKSGEEAAKSREPSAEDKARLAKAGLDEAKTQEVLASMQGTDAESQLDYMAMAQGDPKVYS